MRDQLTALAQQMLDKGIRLEEAHREFERIFIQRALAKCDFNVCRAAEMIGMHRNTLSRKIAAYRIRKSA
ncbi:MAG: helix-turn-helix domain-containing protein [Acidobacteriota bacterium]|jgi:Fis family transcriptional regulator|nr:MAG: histidine kinase [Acidobacteriota bacterium]